MILAIVEQYVIPLVHNSLVPFKANDMVRIVERAMKLSIPNVYVWLLGFYVFFHLYLNITAELLRFADRQFYKDWWYVSYTFSCEQELYYAAIFLEELEHASLSMDANDGVLTYAQCRIFSVSNRICLLLDICIISRGKESPFVILIIQLIIAVPFQMFKWWAFFGMVSQVGVTMSMLMNKVAIDTNHHIS